MKNHVLRPCIVFDGAACAGVVFVVVALTTLLAPLAMLVMMRYDREKP